MTRRLVPGLLLATLTACTSTEPETYPDIAGDYAGIGVGITAGINVSSTFQLTLNQSGGSFHGQGTTEGIWTDLSGTDPYQSEYTFEGTVDAGDPPGLVVTFNSGCVDNLYRGNVLPSGDLVLDGQAQVTGAECEPTGEVLEVVIYLGREG